MDEGTACEIEIWHARYGRDVAEFTEVKGKRSATKIFTVYDNSPEEIAEYVKQQAKEAISRQHHAVIKIYFWGV